MLNEFNRSYIGFQEKEQVGNIFTQDGDSWVIIKILSTKIMLSLSPVIHSRVIAQKVNPSKPYTDFTNTNTITNKIPVAVKNQKDIKIKTLGEVIQLKDRDTDGTALAIITGVDNFNYEHTDLVITYTIEHIIPWTQDKIDKAVRSNRLSVFKVIEGGRPAKPPKA